MRIVAGLAKGRRLVAPAGVTRPTSDRARESLFNALAASSEMDGARVLDLFAGTGAVGLEALSRGAAEAVLVESHHAAVAVLRRNVEAVGLPGARIVSAPVAAFLRTDPGQPFDLVFADPPYEMAEDDLAQVLAALTAPGWLAAEADVVVERAARSPGPQWPDPLITPVRERRYGDGVLWYGRAR